jgi:hypothetical protein
MRRFINLVFRLSYILTFKTKTKDPRTGILRHGAYADKLTFQGQKMAFELESYLNIHTF